MQSANQWLNLIISGETVHHNLLDHDDLRNLYRLLHKNRCFFERTVCVDHVED